MGSLPHGWSDQVDARNNGQYDRWLYVKRSGIGEYADLPLTLGYYTRDDIPFYYALADAFTICDQHFCSSLTGTTPNRSYLWTGTIRAQQNAKSSAHLVNTDFDHDTNVSWLTFPERLEDLGVSWKVYQNEISVGVGFSEEEDAWLSNFGDNPLEYFTQFNVRLTPAHRQYLQSSAESLPKEIEALRRTAGAKSRSTADEQRLAAALRDKETQLRNIQRELKRWNQESFERLSARDKSLLAKAFCSNSGDPNYRQLSEIVYKNHGREQRVAVPKGDLLHQFRQDVEKGALPTVSWIVPPERFSDHPSSAWYGAWYIAELFDILTNNPEVWEKTVFILTYDENDGYFDHVPPFVAPDPSRAETGRVSKGIDSGIEYVTRHDDLKSKSAGEARDSSIGLGYRVPLIIASPWTRGGFVCSQVFDHTSSLQFLEKFLSKRLGKEVRETNISEWRRTVCGDLMSAFRAETTSGSESIPFPSRDEFVQQIHQAQFNDLPSMGKLTPSEIKQIRRTPAESSKLPRQEPGIRAACALPYELVADGKLSADRRQFSIVLEASNERFGKIAAGAPFVVYARHAAADMRTRDYALSPGDRLEDSWRVSDFAEDRYELAVFGPNGFHRRFNGDSHSPLLDVSCRHRVAADGQPTVVIQVTNCDSDRHAIEFEDAYTHTVRKVAVMPGATTQFSFDCGSSFGWYDLSLRAVGNNQYLCRYAGRVETGRPSYSDPAMGRIAT